MDVLTDTLALIIKSYPKRNDLSNARLTKLVYLADWHHSVNIGHQITGIAWRFDNFGPFVPDVMKTVSEHADVFGVINTFNMFGNPKTLIELKDENREITLSATAQESIRFVIEKTSTMSWSNFIRLVYSTYPITSSPRYSRLDLPVLARQYVEKSSQQ